MEAREYLDLLRDKNDIILVEHFPPGSEEPDGSGTAVIIDREHGIAVMLGDCGSPERTLVKAGALVKLSSHPEAKTQRIIGSPAYGIAPVTGEHSWPVCMRGRKLGFLAATCCVVFTGLSFVAFSVAMRSDPGSPVNWPDLKNTFSLGISCGALGAFPVGIVISLVPIKYRVAWACFSVLAWSSGSAFLVMGLMNAIARM